MDRHATTAVQVARSIGVSHVAIGNFLQGQLPKSEHLLALAKTFGVTTDWLLGLEKPKVMCCTDA